MKSFKKNQKKHLTFKTQRKRKNPVLQSRKGILIMTHTQKENLVSNIEWGVL